MLAVLAALATASAWRSAGAPGGVADVAWSGFVAMTTVAPVLPGRAGQLTVVAGLVALVVAGSTGRRHRCRPSSASTAAAVLCVLLVTWLWLVDVLGVESSGSRAPASATAWATAVAVLVLVRRGGLHPARVVAAATLALTVVLVWSAVGSDVTVACHDGKCTPFGVLLSGPYASENTLAMLSALAGVLAIVHLRGRAVVLVLSVTMAVVLLTGSRTGVLVCAVALTASLGTRSLRSLVSSAGTASRRAQGWSTGLGLAALLVSTGALVTRTGDPTAFTGRGLIWMRAHEALAGHGWTGLGLSRWKQLQAVGELSVHFTHSEYLLLEFAGGVVALLLFAAFLATLSAALVQSHPTAPALGAVPIGALGLYSMTEVVWNPLAVDQLSWSVLALLLVAAHTAARHEDPAPAPSAPARDRGAVRAA